MSRLRKPLPIGKFDHHVKVKPSSYRLSETNIEYEERKQLQGWMMN